MSQEFSRNFWNDDPLEPERKVREINRKTNLFMRALYEKTEEEQITPGKLKLFLENTPGISYDSSRQVWVVDPGLLQV